MNEKLEKELEGLKKIMIHNVELVLKYEKALREIDTHIRATPFPVSYIVETLKNTLPEYRLLENDGENRSLDDWLR